MCLVLKFVICTLFLKYIHLFLINFYSEIVH